MVGIALLLAASVTTQVGNWTVECTERSDLDDGMFEQCLMSTNQNGLRVEIVRTVDGADTLVRQRGCRPRDEVPPSQRTQEDLASEDGNKKLLGSLIENLMQNQISCRARGGVVAIPMTEDEAQQLLDASSKIRGL